MNRSIEKQIIEAEERLRLAMLASDVKVLDELIAPELIFTNHLGNVLSKQDDLTAHKSGLLSIEELKQSEQKIQIVGDIAIASVRMKITGTYGGSPANGDFRFTRVWSLNSSGAWQIIAGHSCSIAG
ncbi:MAG: nuclear transport factor 2 family protein [Cyanobacteria bacterium SBLK]|nr:nuclear transport factor 2 family protein [Cyanobacteria bacterium SBLK]